MFSHFLRKLGSLGRPLADSGALRLGGRRWHLAPDVIDHPDLDRWLADESTSVVKTGPHRTVYRVELPGGTVYVKHCRISGFRAWVREVLRPAKARLEFENALALQQRDIPAVLPLAWGEPDTPWPGESFLVTRSRDGVVPFLQFVEQTLPALPAEVRDGVRRQLAHALGQFLARLHDAGVAHPDPHPGNLLVELPPSRVPHFYLIDLHAVRVGRPLTWPRSRHNLILFNRWSQLRLDRTDRLRFWLAYRRARRTLPLPTRRELAAGAREVERGTMGSNVRFWSGRVVRCVSQNRYYRRVKSGPHRGFAVRDMDEGLMRDLLADPAAAFAWPTTRILKDSRTSTVAELTVGGRSLIWKRFNIRSRGELLKNLVRPSPGLRSWTAGFTVRDRCLPTPRPLLLLHRSRGGLPAEAYLLTEKVPGAVELTNAVATAGEGENAHPWQWVGCILDRVARLIRTMHDRGVSHRDLKASNLLLERGTDPTLIDLVGVRAGQPVPFRQRAKELARLNASFLAQPLITRRHRLRFLRSYLAAGPALGATWKDWWKAIARATAAKVAKNRRTGRPLA